jgi:type I restriction enzyme S subunit
MPQNNVTAKDAKKLPLSELISIQKGKKPAIMAGKIPYIDIKAFEKNIYQNYCNGTDCLLCEDGDLLLVWDGARCGLVGWAKKGAVGSTLVKITPSNDVDKKYLYYFLVYNYQNLNLHPKGTGIPHINPLYFHALQLPLPPLPEQQRIAARLDALFAELDAGVAALKRAKAQMAAYRAAVLNKEFSLQMNRGTIKMKDVSSVFGGAAFKSTELLKTGKYQVIRIGNIRPGQIRLNEKPVFVNDIKNREKYLLKENDVVISLTGTRKKRDYGYTALINSGSLLLNQRNAYIRFDSDYNSKYFMYYSWTNRFKDDFFKNETGNVGQGNVGMNAIIETPIPDTPLEEQQQIVTNIETQFAACDKTEKLIDDSLTKALMLKQSILKKAFRGELV